MKGKRAAKGLIAKRLHHPNKPRQSRVYADNLLLHQYYVKTMGRLLRTPVSAVLRAARKWKATELGGFQMKRLEI